MKRISDAAATFLVVLLWVAAASAQDASSLYKQGDFAKSYRVAVATDSAASQTLAANAAVAFAEFEATSDRMRLDWYQRGADAAQHALKLQPKAVGALLTLAQAKGEAALLRGPLQNLGVAGETRDLLRRVLELQPENPNALVGLGVWNLELTDRGVGWMFGARRKGALAMVERGIERAPDDIELRIEYGRALQLAGDAAAARSQYQLVLKLAPTSAADRFRQQRVAEYLAGERTSP